MYALSALSSMDEMEIIQGEMAFLTLSGESDCWHLGSYWCKKPWRRFWIDIVITACFLKMLPEQFPSSCCVCRLVSYWAKFPKDIVDAPSSEIFKILLDMDFAWLWFILLHHMQQWEMSSVIVLIAKYVKHRVHKFGNAVGNKNA